MSRARITLPISVDQLDTTGTSLELVSTKDLGGDPDNVRYRYTSPKGLAPVGPFDPWKLLDDFFRWPLEDWDAFFFMAGSFGGVYVTRGDFKEWQELLKKALVLPAREWKTLADEFDSKKILKLRSSVRLQFDLDAEPPTAQIHGLTCLGTMIAAIQLDKLRGAEFRACARSDCKSPPFKVGSRQKIFCSSDCAHLVAVRNSRERIASGKPVRKPTTRTTTKTIRGK